MAVPCCAKCGKSYFQRSKDGVLKVVFIYCGSCGAVVSAIPIRKTSGGTSAAKGGVPDDWEAQV